MKTHDHARRTLARFIRRYHEGELSTETFRALVYAMGTLLNYFKLQADLDVERRLEAIENELDLEGRGR